MPINQTLPRLSEDEAYNHIISALRRVKPGEPLELHELTYQVAQAATARVDGPAQYVYDGPANMKAAQPFYSAAWRLCMRGILFPLPTLINRYNHNGVTAGERFGVTEYGWNWLDGLSDYDSVPTEYGRFSQMLSNHSARLGNGFHALSQEAVSCYRAQTYLACCAMCGAAAESTVLALSIAKKGSEEEVLRDYNSAGGRGRIERYLMNGQNNYVQNNLPNFTGLLNYWRDEAAHGANSGIGEEEAFTALLLLLRFARFADERWEEITANPTHEN